MQPAPAPATPELLPPVPGSPGASCRYFAWLYSPPEQRPVLAALCAIEREIRTSLRSDHQVAHARLEWWREEAERYAEGSPVHPLTRSLLASCGRPRSPRRSPAGFVDTAVWDLAAATFESRREVAAYCERWTSAMIEPLVDCALTEAAEADRAAQIGRPLGAALREIELLADLARDARSGRLRLPLDELDLAGVDTDSLAKPPWPPALSDLLRKRHEALRTELASAVAHVRNDEQPRLRALLVWAALAWRTSLRAQRALPGILEPRRAHVLVDGWIAWQAARRAMSGTFVLA